MIPEEGYYQPEVFPWNGGNELTEDLAFMKRKVVPFLLNHPYSGPFRYPVNAKAEGIYPDYFKIVTKPMDLTTVKSRLDNNYYSKLDLCVQDIQQVWTNAKIYNPPEHTIHKWAEELNMITKGWVAKCQQQVSRSPTSSSIQAPTTPAKESPSPAPPHSRISPQTSKFQSSPPLQDPAQTQTNQINLKICENILETMMSDKFRYCSEPFLTITTRYSSDSYNPMDLGMIKTNLSRGHYRNAQEFAADFRRMISETYRYCIDKDPLIMQAQELSHQFEFLFAKRIQFTQDDYDAAVNESFDDIMDDTVILKKILAIGRAMELQLDKMIKKELDALEEKRFNDAQLLVKEIENISPEIMEDVIEIMQRNREELKVEPDGTVEVSYNDLSAKTINEIRKLLHAKNLNSSQNGLKSDIKDESMSGDIS